MRDGRPTNLKDMLREAKDTSELMVDLAYAALFYNSEDISEEVFRLEERLNALVFDMRTLAILAARSPADAEQMAGILQALPAPGQLGTAPASPRCAHWPSSPAAARGAPSRWPASPRSSRPSRRSATPPTTSPRSS